MVGTALHAQSLTIKRAEAVAGGAPTLQLVMSIELGERATEALEAGLMLAFDVDWQTTDSRALKRTVALRYSPLLRSYQLAIGKDAPHTYALRNSLLAAMENAQLRWPDEAACATGCGGRVRVRLNPAALPAPLRLPALFDSDWDFDSGWKELESGAGGRGQGAQSAARSDDAADRKMCASKANCGRQGTGPATRFDRAASHGPCPLPPAPLLTEFSSAHHPTCVGAHQAAPP